MGKRIKEYTEHGIGMYRYRRCRCEICNEAMAVVRAKYRKKSDNYRKMMDATPLLEWLAVNGQLHQVDDSTRRHWAMRGLTVYTIDKVCIRLGVHPAEVYGYRFYEGCFDNG